MRDYLSYILLHNIAKMRSSLKVYVGLGGRILYWQAQKNLLQFQKCAYSLDVPTHISAL